MTTTRFPCEPTQRNLLRRHYERLYDGRDNGINHIQQSTAVFGHLRHRRAQDDEDDDPFESAGRIKFTMILMKVIDIGCRGPSSRE